MSLPDRRNANRFYGLARAGACAVLLAAALASGCTVKPLYSNSTAPLGAAPGAQAGLGQIAIPEIRTRYGQELRNRLIFLLNGGAGQPAAPTYTLNLTVTSADESVAVIQVVNEDRPTAGAIRMYGSYSLTEISTGQVLFSGRREISSSYDRPSQEFAALRAKRDAENRAARELAELLRLDIGQKLATKG